MILTRPWCSVEICSAVANKVKIVVLKCTEFEFYDEEGFRTLKEGWTSSDLLIFGQNAIDPFIIEDSYKVLPSQPVVNFNAFGPEAEQINAVAELLPHAGRSGNAGRNSVTESEVEARLYDFCLAPESPNDALKEAYIHIIYIYTPPKINIEPENDGLGRCVSFPGVYSQVPCSSSWVYI